MVKENVLYVTPGNLEGSELALRNELNAIHHQEPVTKLLNLNHDSPICRIAQAWARQKSIPETRQGEPDIIAVAVDFAGRAEVLNQEIADPDLIWERTFPPAPEGILDKLRGVLRERSRKTVWVNTTHQDYLRNG